MDASQVVGGAPPRLPPWVKTALVISAIWCVPAIVNATSYYTVISLKGEEVSFGELLLWRIPEWQVWAIATPLIIFLGRRFPLSRSPWRSTPIHLGANTAIATVDIIVYWGAATLLGQQPFVDMALMDLLPWMLIKTAFFNMMLYWIVIVVDRYRQSSLRQVQLEARLSEAQLDALKMQLHPHFLFNTINAISVLMRKGESANAIRMLGGMSDLLRRSLTSLRVELVPLDEELEFIGRYLDIETTRFPDRLRVTLDIEPAARRAHVPSLILQPIVENAIEHGIAPRISGGRITITARVTDGKLQIVIRDDGVGLSGETVPRGHGVGLSHVRKRLAQLYPNKHRFTLESGEPGEPGAIATLELPYQEAGA